MKRFLNDLIDEKTAEEYGIINAYKLDEDDKLTLVFKKALSSSKREALEGIVGGKFDFLVLKAKDVFHHIKFSDIPGNFMQDVFRKRTKDDDALDKYFSLCIKPFFPLVGELKKKTKDIKSFIQIQTTCPVCYGLGKNVIGKSKEEVEKLFKEKQRQAYNPDYKSELDIDGLGFKRDSLNVALHNHVNGHVHLRCSECGEGFIE